MSITGIGTSLSVYRSVSTVTFSDSAPYQSAKFHSPKGLSNALFRAVSLQIELQLVIFRKFTRSG